MAKRVIVVGGGPAGMLAAYSAAMAGASVTLLEKNEKLGKKLFLTGKGRCNLTNSADISDFFENIPKNPRFLYSAFSAFSNADLTALMEENGLPLKTERGGRVFPASDKSSDVIKTLERLLRKAGVKVAFDVDVRGLKRAGSTAQYRFFDEGDDYIEGVNDTDGRVLGVITSIGFLPCDAVILATGGLSYQATGSTGDGHYMATQSGHAVTDLNASLTGLETRENLSALAGLTLKNVAFKLCEGKKTLFSDMGELLFTHTGVSGPLVLSSSAHLRDYKFSDTTAFIDLKPALDEKTLDARIIRDFDEQKNKELKNALSLLLPQALIPFVIERAGIPPEKKVNSVTAAERRELLLALKGFSLRITGTRPIDEAIITRGGVAVSEIDPKTMRSKKVANLFFAGELIDVDAYTGGFNLQIAFSTGYLAGKSAAAE